MKDFRKKSPPGSREENYSLLLLAGGKSSRMGRDKAELLLEGRSFLSCIIEKGAKLGIREIYLSGHGWNEGGAIVHEVPDRYRERGPLGGMYSCMPAMDTPYALVLPVDMPQIPLQILERLLQAHEEKLSGCAPSEDCPQGKNPGSGRPLLLAHGDRTEPLIGIYPTALGERIGRLIENKAAPVFRLLDETGYDICRVSAEEWELENINTPEDYQRLTALRKRGKTE